MQLMIFRSLIYLRLQLPIFVHALLVCF